jgi:hypothetical protein
MPVIPVGGAESVKVALPFTVVFVEVLPAAPPSRLLVAPACDRVMLRPLSLVTLRPFASCTETVMVDV